MSKASALLIFKHGYSSKVGFGGGVFMHSLMRLCFFR